MIEPCAGAQGQRTASVQDLAWIAGHWIGEMDGTIIEERWAEPLGGSMMGMFRLVKDGKARFLEFMTIDPGESGPVLKLRHFHPGLIAWEEKDKPLNLLLVGLAGREAIFELDDKSRPTKIIFRAEPPKGAAASLTIVLEKETGGTRTSQDFRYRRDTR
jgi:hypothetical protein